MLKLIGWTLRASVFAVVILVIGNWIRWKGTTLSDHVKSGMAQVERRVDLPELSAHLKEASKIVVAPAQKPAIRAKAESTRNHIIKDGISDTEKARLRTLLQEVGQ